MDITQQTHGFITGGASGIGLAIGDALLARGAAVTLADIDDEALAAVVASRHGRVRGVVLDVRDREGWAQAKAQAETSFGPVDLLANNAGIAPDGKQLVDMDPTSFDRVLGINLTGVFNGISTFGAGIRALGRGHIVNTASMAGLEGFRAGFGSYGTAKAAVAMMSEVLHAEMAPHGVGVSVLCPGVVATNIASSTIKAGGELRAGSERMTEGGISAQGVGEKVVRAVMANRLYIMTHSEEQWPVRPRFVRILEGFDPV